MAARLVRAWDLQEGDRLGSGAQVLAIRREVRSREVLLTVSEDGATRVAVWLAEAPLDVVERAGEVASGRAWLPAYFAGVRSARRRRAR